MTIRKILVISSLAFFLMFLLGISGAAAARNFSFFFHSGESSQVLASPAQQVATPAQGTGLPGTDDAIREALRRTVEQNQSLILGFQVFDVVVDHIQYSQDGSVALLWLALRDRETGQVVETEPGLSIANNVQLAAPQEANSWSILLQTTAEFNDRLRALPPELLTQDIRDRFLEPPAEFQMEAVAAVFSGYKLPWTSGLSKRVTNSIGHVYSVAGGLTSCPTSCMYAFDFADGTMFPLIAAKGGRVKAAKWSCSNGDTNCANYLILEDESTNPTTYQVYYHLAYNSIPTRLRSLGAQVRQGEYIGDVDDTGVSTGHHLHYHVYVSPTRADWAWGNSVDITFDDVSTNGGRPRTCAEASAYPNLGSQCMPNNQYRSGNTPANPPVGSLDLPQNRQWVRTRTVRVQGSASDDIQITRILVVANYDGTWKTIDEITPAGNGPYGKDVDLCAANVPDGPLALTVRIYDREGSLAPGIPVRHLLKNYPCGGASQYPRDVRILYPTGALAPTVPFTISAGATDFDGGNVARVDFFWHGPDWNQGWVKLGSDTNGADGWNLNADPRLYGNVRGSALYVQAVSRGGGVLGAAAWDLEPDFTMPTSQMNPLPALINSTVIGLSWSASDPINDIAQFEIHYQVSTGGEYSAWQKWATMPTGDRRTAWFTGTPGSSYRFRMRAIDRASNIEAFPDSFEAVTSLAGSCTPDPNEVGQTSVNLFGLTNSVLSPQFNFCKSTVDGSADVDWAAFDARAGEDLTLMFLARGGGTRLRVSIYSAQSQLLGTWLASDHTYPVIQPFRAPATGRYYVEIKPAQTNQFGTDMTYQIWFGKGNILYMPIVHR